MIRLPNSFPPIMTFPPKSTDFSGNGSNILTPISAEVEIKENEAYKLHLVHPVDDFGNWKALKMSAILKVPIKIRDEIIFEPLRIYKIKKERNGNSARITVDARSTFYDLNYVMIPHVEFYLSSCKNTMQKLFSEFYHPTGYAQACEHFTYNSDIGDLLYGTYDKKTLTACLIGDSKSVLNLYNGELYVHGNYFSINRRRETAKDNIFSLKYGINLSGITATYDIEKTYNCLYSESSTGETLGRQVSNESLELPYDKVAYKKFSYDDDHPASQFPTDTDLYFKDISNLNANYTVNFADLPATEEYRQYKNLSNCEIGDTGIVEDDDLAIKSLQKVTAKKIDIMTQTTKSLTLGTFIPSIADLDKFRNNIFYSPPASGGGIKTDGNKLIINTK